MAVERNRFIYFSLTFLVVALGLGSRLDFLPRWSHLYLGDIFWALMIFLIIGIMFKRKSIYWVAVAALSFSFLIEFSQLYQASWINDIRHTKIGGLVLGFSFLWSDLFSYMVGVSIGILLEKSNVMKGKNKPQV